MIEHTTPAQLVRCMKPLSILRGFERLDASGWQVYHQLLRGYFPHEIERAVIASLQSDEWFPPPKTMLDRLRRTGTNALRNAYLEAQQRGELAPGLKVPELEGPPLSEFEAERIVRQIPGTGRIGR